MLNVATATQFFSILTLIAQVSVIIIFVSLLFKNRLTKKVISFFGGHALLLGFIVALVSMLGSLFYSEIAGYTPCKLCWYQRILIYPQVILLGIAFAKKDQQIALYSIVLSILGAGIALYHYLIQIGTIGEILPCSTVGYSVSCAEKFVMTYGYITIPMMSLSAFLLILSLMLAQEKLKGMKKLKKENI
jgi:disulfide bond formation protein DsbB